MINILNRKDDLSEYENCQYVGRGSVLGNPYTHIPEGTKADFIVKNRKEAIDKYEIWLRSLIENNDPLVMSTFNQLYNIYLETGELNLVCYCAPLRCHGEVISELIEERWEREHSSLVNKGCVK